MGPVAYFSVQEFVDNLSTTDSLKNQYEKFITQLGNEFLFDVSEESDKNALMDILNSIYVDDNVEDFIDYTKRQINNVKNSENEKLAEIRGNIQPQGNISHNPQHHQTEKRVEKPLKATKSRMKLGAEFKDKVGLAQNYFSNNSYVFNAFESRIKKELFRAALVDFKQGRTIRNDADLCSNLQNLYNETKAQLFLFMKGKNPNQSEDTLIEDSLVYFKKWDENNIESIVNDEDFVAYTNYVILSNGFDNMVELYGLGLVKPIASFRNNYDSENFDKKYTISNANKFAFSYGNDNYSILDETNDVLKTLFRTTPIVTIENGVWKNSENSYLDITSATTVIAKLKGVIDGLSQDGRISPILKLQENLEKIVNDTNNIYSKVFTNSELDTLRTIYAYFYADPNDERVTKDLGIHSLVEIYSKEFAESRNIENDVELMINVTRHFDNSVRKMYSTVTFDKEYGDYKVSNLEEINVNKHYRVIENNISSKINDNYQRVSEDFSHFLNIGEKKITLGKNSYILNQVYPLTIPTSVKDLLFKMDNNKQLTPEETSFYEALKTADDILGFGLFDNNHTGLKLLTKDGADSNTAVLGFLKLAGNVVYLADVKKRAEETKGTSKLKDKIAAILDKEKIFRSDDYMKKSDILHVTDLDADKSIKNFLKNYASVKAVLSGDTQKAVIATLSGSSMPSIGILSPTHDDNTSFAEIEDDIRNHIEEIMEFDPISAIATLKEIPINHNLFVQVDADTLTSKNRNFIVGEHLRTPIRNAEGDTKNPEKMSAAEIMTQAIIHDFYGNMAYSKENYVALQPLVYADKIGQMLKRFKMTGTLNYNGVDYNMSTITSKQLESLHYQTMSGQLLGLERRIVSDYYKMFNNSDYVLNKISSIFKNSEIFDQTNQVFDENGIPILTPEEEGKDAKQAIAKYKRLMKLINEINEYNLTLKYEDFSELIELFSEEELVNLAKNKGVELTHEIHYSGRKGGKLNSQLLTDFKLYRTQANHASRMRTEKLKMVRDMLRIGVVIDAQDSKFIDGKVVYTNKPSIENALKMIKQHGGNADNWIDEKTGELVLFRKNGKNGTLDMIDGNEIIRTDQDIEINPLLEFFFWTHNVMTSNYNLATAGGTYAHEIKGADYNPEKDMELSKEERSNKTLMQKMKDEAIISGRTTASDKRNVFAQATSWHVQQDHINGIPRTYNTAVVNDTSFKVFNTIGQEENFKNWDGSSMQPAFAMALTNNALGSMSTKDFTHKIIHHRYDPNYMVAELEKFAAFGVDNEVCRKSKNSKFNGKDFMFKTTGMPVTLEGQPLNLFNDAYHRGTLIEDSVNPGVFMFDYLNNVKVMTEKGQIYTLIGFSQVVNVDGLLLYAPQVILDGETKITSLSPVQVNSVFDLWQLLGGEYSIEENPDGNIIGKDNKKYIYSEKSIYDTVSVMNNFRKKKEGNRPDFAQSSWDQPFKTNMIYQVNNTSGIKNGAKNINKVSKWTDPVDYNLPWEQQSSLFTTYKTSSIGRGLQMNSDHGFDEEHVAQVTEMSQVISAAAANGHYNAIAEILYKNIASVVRSSMSKYNKALAASLNGDKVAYQVITKELMKLLADKDQIGFAQIYLQRVEASLKAAKHSNPEAVVGAVKTAFSDNNFFGAMGSMIAGSVNRTAIKRKYSGIASVINPGFNVYTVAQDENGNIINGEDAKPIYKVATIDDIQFGDRIQYNSADGPKDYDFHNPTDYAEFRSDSEAFIKNRLKGVDGTFLKAFNYARNLRGYDVTVTLPDGRIINRYDLDSVRAILAFNKYNSFINDINSIDKKIKDLGKTGSIYQIKKLQDSRAVAVLNLELFKTGELFRSLRETLNTLGYDESVINDKNASKELNFNLQKLVEQDHLNLENGILKVPSLLQNTFGNGSINVQTNVKSGEVIMSNFNRLKFGIEKGTKLQNINEAYFKRKLDNIEFSSETKSQFYIKNFDGQEIHFIHQSHLSDLKYAKEIVLKTEIIEDDNGVEQEYFIDPNTGTRMFKAEKYTNSDGEEVYTTKVYDVNGITYVSYDTVEDLDNIVADEELNYQSFNVNFKNKHTDTIHKYMQEGKNPKLSDMDVEEITAILKYKSSKLREDKYKAIKTKMNARKARQMYQSWKKQLEVIGARIPAQSLQSFMAMEIVGFVDDDINTVILPTIKNWLDGSDFDIDKTYMMGFGVDNSGMLYAFNKFFDYDYIETAYLNMVVPTGEQYDFNFNGVYEDPNLTINALNYILTKDTSSSTKEGYEAFLKLVANAAEVGEIELQKIETVSEVPYQKLIDAINKYHKRIPSEKVMLEASKNAVTQSLITLSRKVGNIYSGERPVDMDDPKEAKELSNLKQDSRELARENPTSIAMQIIQQNSGKSVVGISAVGEKVFFAASFYMERRMKDLEEKFNKGELDESGLKLELKKMSGIKPIIYKDGSIIVPNLLANTNMSKSPNVQEAYEVLKNELIDEYRYAFDNNDKKSDNAKFVVLDVNNQKDMSLVISAVLSAATDNAKELILAKINAGPELAGMYMYMIMQGVEFMDIAKFMISPVINKVVAKAKANWFNSENSGNSIDNAIAYYLTGPNPYNYLPGEAVSRVEKLVLNKAGLKDITLQDFLANSELEKIENVLIGLTTEENIDYIDLGSYDSDTGEYIPGKKIPIKHGLHKLFRDAINRKKEVTEEMLLEIDRFNKIKEDSEETNILGRRLGVNQGVKTTQYDAYSYDYSINSYVSKKVIESGIDINNDEFHTLYKDLIKYGIIDGSPSINERNKQIADFLSDIRGLHNASDDIKKLAERAYEPFKSVINIIGIELSLPHYAAMIGAAYTVDGVLSDISLKYKGVNILADRMAEEGYINKTKHSLIDDIVKGYPQKLTEDQYKDISNFLSAKIVEDYFKQKHVSFKIPSGAEYIEYDPATSKYVKKKFEGEEDDLKVINLNTPEGKASFKLFFDTFFVPNLQKNEKNNKFVKMLTKDSKRNSITGSEYRYYKLDFDMSSVSDDTSKNPNAQIKFNELKNAFEQLNGKDDENGNNIWDMFAIYNIIINKNGFGSNTFTKLFQSSTFVTDPNARFYDFMTHEGNLDYEWSRLERDITHSVDFINDLALRAAPIEKYVKKATKTDVKYFKVYDPSTERYNIHERNGEGENANYNKIKQFPNDVDDMSNFMLDEFLSEEIYQSQQASQLAVKSAYTDILDSLKTNKVITLINC